MKGLLNWLITLRNSGEKMHRTPLSKTSKQNVTPEWIDTLEENEIFVFGCRNSGRHFDGASNFALEHFGAIMGQREGLQGQSYAIPTIGGVIGLKEIRQSVDTFTKYATEHPELHFLVTPVGCGDGCQSEWDIAPMFSKVSKLPNVSLPISFWNALKLQNIKRPSIVYRPSNLYEELMAEYRYGHKRFYWRVLYESPLILFFKQKDSLQTYLVNCDTEQVVEMIDADGVVKIFSHEDIDFSAIDDIRAVEQLFLLRALYGIGVWGFNKDGISLVRWGVGGLNQFNCPNAYIDGYIDTDFRVVIPFKSIEDPFHDDYYRLAKHNREQLTDKKSIWR